MYIDKVNNVGNSKIEREHDVHDSLMLVQSFDKVSHILRIKMIFPISCIIFHVIREYSDINQLHLFLNKKNRRKNY